MATTPATTPARPTFGQAAATFERAFKQLKTSVTSSDADIFQITTLQEVKDAATAIEARQRERKSMHNMARLRPFFQGLEKYSKSIDVLCNGTDYLPWIWVRLYCLGDTEEYMLR